MDAKTQPAAPPNLPVAGSREPASIEPARETDPVLASGPERQGEPGAPPAPFVAPAAPAVREANTANATVHTAVTSPAWPEDVAQKFAQFVSLGAGDAEIHLNPAHLGPVGIEITYGDRQASVLITAAQPATRDALEQALPHLKELLAQQGIALGESAVRDHREARADADPYRPPSGDTPAREGALRARTTDEGLRDRMLRPSSRLIDTFA
jgi:flagellar hook-length control protein FliK